LENRNVGSQKYKNIQHFIFKNILGFLKWPLFSSNLPFFKNQQKRLTIFDDFSKMVGSLKKFSENKNI